MKTPNEVIEDWLISAWARDRKLGDLAIEALEQEGYVIVLEEPTEEMLKVGQWRIDDKRGLRSAYQAMIKEAPDHD